MSRHSRAGGNPGEPKVLKIKGTSMGIKIHVPLKSQVINGGFVVQIVGQGIKWSTHQLGKYAKSKGVYIYHSKGEILYVGNTTGTKMNFGMRLRRECQERAAGNSKLHQDFRRLKSDVCVFLLDLDAVNRMVDAKPSGLDDKRKALILEQILIGIFNPRFNRQ